MSSFPTNLPKCDNSTPHVGWKNLSKGENAPKVLLFDANGLVLGRLASVVAQVLRAKTKASYTPQTIHGDMVVIINVEKIAVTGRKETEKVYYRHSGYPGGIKAKTVKDTRNGKTPEMMIFLAVKGMLGQSKMAKNLLKKKLRLYTGEDHPHAGQQPIFVDFAAKSRKNSTR